MLQAQLAPVYIWLLAYMLNFLFFICFLIFSYYVDLSVLNVEDNLLNYYCHDVC